MTLSPGARLGPFEVLAPLGAGGMGEVYRAKDTRLSREVAIKVLPAELSSDAARLKRFEKEALSASSLNHPNIVTIYEVGREGATEFIAMELVEGKTLRALLGSEPIPLKRLLVIASQIADGLAKAHASGIVHRDLKPENVMVTPDGHVKILDFGLAKLTRPEVDSDSGLTQTPTVSADTGAGVVMGTVGYMSPEQACGRPVDFRSDQFSFGAIVYEMATGRRAFQRETAPEALAAIIREEPEPIAALNPKTPVPLRWIVERCLAKDPRERYASTEDLARDLAAVRDHLSEASGSGSVSVAAAGPRSRSGLAVAGLAAAFAIAVVAAVLAGRRLGTNPILKFQRITFRHGRVSGSVFAPDGQTIVYSAAWEGSSPDEIYSTRVGSLEARTLGIQGWILSVSSSGDMAFVLPSGTLARAPLAGGSPRELVTKVAGAGWAPDADRLAVIHHVQGKNRLEFPIGRVLYETANRLDNLHLSPTGDLLAYREMKGQIPEGGGEVFLLDASGGGRRGTGLRVSEFGWAPSGKELWYINGPAGSGCELRGVSLSGRDRVIAGLPGTFQLDDIDRNGRLLIERLEIRGEIRGLAPGDPAERSLAWLDFSKAVDLSRDGKLLLFNELSHGRVYVRRTDGSPAVPLGDGRGLALSPDGEWALTVREGTPPQLVLLPRGPGEARTIPTPGFESFAENASFLPDGKHLLVTGTERGRGPRLYVMDVERGDTRPVSPEGVQSGWSAVSPDGRFAFARGAPAGWLLYALEPGSTSAPLPIAGLGAGDVPMGWTADSRSLYVQGAEENPAPVYRLDFVSGKRELFREFRPSDAAGIWWSRVIVTPDGRGWVYSVIRNLGDLYLVEGLARS